MSSSQTNYKLDEAQAIFNELRSIKKVISTGEKERQDLIQVSDLNKQPGLLLKYFLSTSTALLLLLIVFKLHIQTSESQTTF